MKKNYNLFFPKNLILWMKGDILKYRAEEKEIDPSILDFLKSNKEFFKSILKNTGSESIKVLPLSHNQKALWFLRTVSPENTSYNIALAAEIKNPIIYDALSSALVVLTEQFPMLRTIFAYPPESDSAACQIVLEKINPVIEQIDGSTLNDEQIRTLLHRKSRLPFDFEEGPMFRVTVVTTAHLTILCFNFHHIICDAISLKHLLNDFIRHYTSIIQNENIVKSSTVPDYSSFIFEQLEFLNSTAGENQLNYWVKQLGEKPHILNLPAKYERPVIHQFNGSTLLFRIEGDRYHHLRYLARIHGATFNVLLLSAFEFFISKISRQRDFFIGLPASARTNRDYENIFGYLINLLPLGCSISDQKTFIAFLKENKEHVYESLEYQMVPFPVIVEKASPDRDLSRTPVFQVIFNYLNKKTLGCLLHFLGDEETSKFSSWGSLLIKPYRISDQEGQVNLTLEMIDDDTKLLCALKYNTDLFDAQTADFFKDEFLKIIGQILEDPEIKPSWLTEEQVEKSKKPVLQIGITGTFTVEPMKPYLEFWMDKFGIDPSIIFPGYNQIFSQLLHPTSEFNSNHSGYNILLIRFEDWMKDKNSEYAVSDLTQKINEFIDALASASQRNPEGKYIFAICPSSDKLLKDPFLSKNIEKAEKRFCSELKSLSNVIILNSAELIHTYDVSDYYEEMGEEVGHIPFTDEFFISLATIIVRKIHASFRPPFKAIAVDCDNTLWKGVVGEDGPSGVRIGKAEQSLQEFLVDQMNSGTLICLCSKNREEDVFEVFKKNRQMILKKEHITFHRINWNPKSENLRQLAKEINIGLDSFVFIDDSPIECAEVRNNAPEVLTIQLPGEGFNTKQLQNSWIFDRLRVTDEDLKRSEKYREEAVRNSYKSSVKSYKEFISGLNLQIEIIPFKEESIPRISQLTYKTNQFNFTSRKRSEVEIKNISEDKNFDCFQISLSDRFGEYGLVGVIVVNKSTGYNVDTFLLSCRVLGKGVEHSLISFLGEKARLNTSDFLSIHFIKTAKNIPAKDFLVSNFGDFNTMNDDNQTFKIPTESAAGFTFDPERATFYKAESKEGKINVDPEPFKRQGNNDFYYMIFERYLSLENLVAELNKRTEVQSESGYGSLISLKQTEKNVMSVWQQVLKSENFSTNDNFFDIGGHSVLIPQIVIKLSKQFNQKINIVDIFQFPTVRELASFIDNSDKTEKTTPGISLDSTGQLPTGKEIAIIGMAGRFSGVENVEDFWKAISFGKETITYYTKEELLEKGVDERLLENEEYVLANGNMDSADKFDSAFFGVTPREADFMDPQQRVFLESCYEALENAGYSSEKYQGEIGVFAGCGPNNYLLKNLFQHPESLNSIGEFQTIINNNSDYLTTRISYKLNLTGPSINVQTACSTSMVAIHLACQNLLSHGCDMALAGGVFIQFPHAEGYMYEPGGIFSPDGHCRPFDSKADGTLFGEGSGVIVLKRLEDAIKDGDTISAVIKGSAINNDGSAKVGYMAPSVNGQVSVIRKAIAAAGISPETVSYIEAHGTGTRLGDPIEVNALSQVYKKASDAVNHCALGSVKANIGHLDAAAGVAGMIKVILMLKNRKLPPLVNFLSPNPELPLNDTTFYFNSSLTDWSDKQGARRAGISSFGIGGTNGHCILEEAPDTVSKDSAKKYHLVPVTAKTLQALMNAKQSISSHTLCSGQDIGDIAFTLQQGRSHYRHRSLQVYKKEPGEKNPSLMTDSEFSGLQELYNPAVVFMFTGQGSQYAGMTEDLYNEFSIFRDIVDRANLYLQKNFNLDIQKYILNGTDDSLQNEINQTSVAQPLLFVVQYAIYLLLREFGISPDALIGHSIGEYAAATVSGVFEFEDALKLVAWRGKLMQEQKPGAMLAVQLSYDKILPYISNKVNLSLRNAPGMNVLSGDIPDIAEVYERFASEYPDSHLVKLKTSHAFHSYMMEPVLDPFREILKTVKFGASKLPFISNKTGTWIRPGDLSVDGYWTDQIRSTVNFTDGIQELLNSGHTYFIEVGPGNILSTLLSQFDTSGKKILRTSTVRHPKKKLNDSSVFLKAVAHAWVSGVDLDWSKFYQDEKRFRVPLPAYPFKSERHWIDPVTSFNFHTNPRGRSKTDSTDAPATDHYKEVIDESALLSHNRPAMDNEYIPPVSETEIAVAQIWEELLGIKGIGIEDDFFYLGGHSLLASQVTNRISEKFHVRLPLETLFASPTIKGLIEKIESEAPSVEFDTAIISLDPENHLPVSLDQKRLWIIHQIDPKNPAYNIPFTYMLKGKLDVTVFKRSLDILFKRQAILRSSIKSDQGEPYCIIHHFKNIPIKILDFSSLVESTVESKIQSFFSSESREIFDIENGPLFRLYLVKIRADEYIFHMTVQHMVFDGWSWGIFAGELRQIYNDLLDSREIKLSPLKNQYYDIANWQKENEKESTFSGLAEYWKVQLKDHPAEINFPYDHRRGKTNSGLGGRVPLKLSAELTGKLKSLSHDENATVFTTLLAVFGLLLNKYSGDEDICVGAPTANRDNSNVEEIIGLFVNTIVLRLHFKESQSFRDLLHMTRETTLNALAHKNLPFDKLVETLQPDRKTNANPIAQILFAYQNTPRPPLTLRGINPERILIKNTISPFDLTFYAWEENGIIEGELEYNSDILERDTILRLKKNFIKLFQLIIENPEANISTISILSGEESSLIESFRGTPTAYPKEKTIVQLFKEQALLYPNQKAVIYKKEIYTYRNLDERTTQLSETLKRVGVTANMPVALLTEKSAEMIIGILAILKAGGGYVPIDPEYPQQRIDFMLEDAGCKVLLTREKFMEMHVNGVTRISLDSAASYNAEKSDINAAGSSSDLAYIMYTSGTTGKPKGSMIPQHSVVRLVRDTNYIELTSSDRILLTGAIVFDASTFEIWGALLNGASLYIVDKETILDYKALGQELQANKITVLWLTSPLFTQLAERGSEIFSGLKYLLVGGDVLSAPHINKVRKNNPDLKIINGYGPTENTTFSTAFLIIEDFESSIPIGKPISNSTAYILDKNLNYQPIGVIGELFVGGDGLAKGYLNREDLNQKNFIVNPYVPGERLYRTGDYARWLSDGNIDFRGRIDNQLKIRGFRVEIEEIESVISETEGVIETVVKPVRIKEGDTRLAAFLNIQDSFKSDAKELKGILKEKLPLYMIPTVFKFMHGFPKTINGKTDKDALKPDMKKFSGSELKEPGTNTSTEKIILGIWRECLETDEITIDDNFFEIGGNSLLAISVFSKIESAFKLNLSLRIFFDSPRIKDLAEIIDIAKQKIFDNKPDLTKKDHPKIIKGQI